MKPLFSTCILFFSIITLSFSSSILEREWFFETIEDVSRDFTFSIEDTLSIAIHFSEKIPDHIINKRYCRIKVAIPDTAVLAKTGYTAAFRIDFDAGFLYFNHTLTFKLNYNSGILPSVMSDPSQFMMFRDPFPVTKIHQWFNINSKIDSFFIDSANAMVGFNYNHPKYNPDTSTAIRSRTVNPTKSRIVSTGYPFLYGLFYEGDVAIKHLPLIGFADPGMFNLTIDRNRKTIRLVSESSAAQRPLRILLLTINGRTKAMSKKGNTVSYENCSTGIYMLSVCTDNGKNIYSTTILIQ